MQRLEALPHILVFACLFASFSPENLEEEKNCKNQLRANSAQIFFPFIILIMTKNGHFPVWMVLKQQLAKIN